MSAREHTILPIHQIWWTRLLLVLDGCKLATTPTYAGQTPDWNMKTILNITTDLPEDGTLIVFMNYSTERLKAFGNRNSWSTGTTVKNVIIHGRYSARTGETSTMPLFSDNTKEHGATVHIFALEYLQSFMLRKYLHGTDYCDKAAALNRAFRDHAGFKSDLIVEGDPSLVMDRMIIEILRELNAGFMSTFDEVILVQDFASPNLGFDKHLTSFASTP